MTDKPKVAIVHYWLDSYRGGEKVVEALCELYPEADIYTHIYKPENLPETITKHKVYTTFISRLPFAKRFYRHYLPLMPIALIFLNLKKYDLVISSESGPAKGIRKGANALHVCYCHSPMRYIWDMGKEYIDSVKFRVKSEEPKTQNLKLKTVIFRVIWKITACYMRMWDRWSAKQVDYFVANSKFISARIRKFYGRKSTVIHPPCDTNKFRPDKERENFYLCASQLVSYKKVGLVVDAFNKLGLVLVVIGGGADLEKIKAMSKSNVKILGKVTDEVLKEKFELCKAFVYAGKEDFGIVFAEALSAGAPIIAYGKGGVKDIVINGKTGAFFYKQDIESICQCVRSFEDREVKFVPPVEISQSAQRFSRDIFKEKILGLINSKLNKHFCP